jgi:hypothetical protein
VYDTTALPDDIPSIPPSVVTVTLPVLLLTQVPPSTEFDNVAVFPVQITNEPIIDPGLPLTEIVIRRMQPAEDV